MSSKEWMMLVLAALSLIGVVVSVVLHFYHALVNDEKSVINRSKAFAWGSIVCGVAAVVLRLVVH